MVYTNTKYLFSVPGIAKIVTIVFVLIAVALAGHAYENSWYNIIYTLADNIQDPTYAIPDGSPGLGREKFFLAIVGMIFIISVLLLLCHIMNEEFSYGKGVKLADVGFHILGALFLIIAGSLIIASARKINKDICNPAIGMTWQDTHASEMLEILSEDDIKCQYKAEKEVAGSFAIIGSLVYGFVAVIQVLRLNTSPSTTGGTGTMMNELRS